MFHHVCFIFSLSLSLFSLSLFSLSLSPSTLRDNEDVYCSVKKLQEFRVPQFMLDKMKAFMRSVQGQWPHVSVCPAVWIICSLIRTAGHYGNITALKSTKYRLRCISCDQSNFFLIAPRLPACRLVDRYPGE